MLTIIKEDKKFIKSKYANNHYKMNYTTATPEQTKCDFIMSKKLIKNDTIYQVTMLKNNICNKKNYWRHGQ